MKEYSGYIQTFIARAKGNILEIDIPPYTTLSKELDSPLQCFKVAKFIRKNGVACSSGEIDLLIMEFSK